MYVFSFIHTYHSSTRPVLSFVLCYPKNVANLVPEVSLEPRDSREAAKTRREAARKRKTFVTLDLSLTFMQTPAVKRVQLKITKGRTNGNLAIALPLDITNQTNQSY